MLILILNAESFKSAFTSHPHQGAFNSLRGEEPANTEAQVEKMPQQGQGMSVMHKECQNKAETMW